MRYRFDIVAANHTGTLSRIARILESRNHALLSLQSGMLEDDLSRIRLVIAASPQSAEKIRLLLQRMIGVIDVHMQEALETL
ncbi:MAG: hypothetical protein QHH01_02005 [Spirochaetales bacterium]|nr:hypothetical protein [Spirochaetales bacterium]